MIEPFPILPARQIMEIFGDSREALGVVVSCTRVLTLAHLLTAEDCLPQPFTGAGAAQIRRIWEDQFQISSRQWTRDWERYRQAWDCLHRHWKLTQADHIPPGARPDAPRLLEREGVVTFLTDRTRRGHYRTYRPTIPQVLHLLLGDAIPPLLMSDWYRANLQRTYAIEDTPRFHLFAQEFIDGFNRLNSQTVSRRDLLKLALGTPGDDAGRWTQGLLETLESLALVTFAEQQRDGYRLRFKADPAFLFANLFGRSTGVEGLDYLLFGGLWVPAGQRCGENLTAVIRGPAGVGKSTLGLGIGAQVAARGGVCLYFRFEPDESAILRQLSQFHGRLLPFFDVRSHRRNILHAAADASQPRLGKARAGQFWIADLPGGPREVIRETVAQRARMAEEFEENAVGLPKGSGPAPPLDSGKIAVFDSISSAEDYGADPSEWRGFLFELSQTLRVMGYVVVYLVETNLRAQNEPFEEYVADVDAELCSQPAEASAYAFRLIELKKTRWQTSHRGKHPYSIQTGVGMLVFPSSAAVINARRHREVRVRFNERNLIHPGIENFSACFNSPSHPGNPVRWWQMGSVTAVIGPRGTQKTEFGKAFAEAVRPADSTPSEAPAKGRRARGKDAGASSALSLHFADEFQSALSEFRPSMRRPCAFGVRYDVPLTGNAGADGVAPRVCYVLFRSGFLNSGQVLQTVRDLLAEHRRAQTPIRRAVISDAGNLASCFPSLHADPLFVPTLCDLLSSEAVTSVLVYSEPKQHANDHVMEQVRSAAENIIRFSLVRYEGRERTALTVERSCNSSHNRQTCELVEHAGRLCVRPSFGLAVAFRSGLAVEAEVRILLDAGTQLQKAYHSEIRAFHHTLDSYRVQVLDYTSCRSRRQMPARLAGKQQGLWIVQFDAYELPPSSESGEDFQGARVVDLVGQCPQLAKELDTMVCLPGPKHSSRYSLPYFLNPSLLTARKDFLEYAATRPAWAAIAQGEGNYGWDELLECAQAFAASVGEEAPPLFDLAFETQETLNCLFLEILFSLVDNPWRQPAVAWWGPAAAYRLSSAHAALARACGILADALRGSWPPASPSSGRGTAERPPAVFCRHWYTTFRAAEKLSSARRLDGSRDFVWLRLPRGVHSSGDWHFSILEGSTGPARGVEILLEQFINSERAVDLLARGVGLPPYRSLYEESFGLSRQPLTWFLPYIKGEGVIYRSRIRNYRAIAPMMGTILDDMLARSAPAAKPSDEPIREGTDALANLFLLKS